MKHEEGGEMNFDLPWTTMGVLTSVGLRNI